MRNNIYIEKKQVGFFKGLTSWSITFLKGVATLLFVGIAFFVFTCKHSEASQIKKCDKYRNIIISEIAKYDNSKITAELVCGVMSVESSFRTKVISHYGAVGLMQITTHAMNDYNLYNEPIEWQEVTRVENNILLGVWYLHRTHREAKKYSDGQSIAGALSAYYWGLSRATRLKLIHTDYSKKVLERYKYFLNASQPKIKQYNYRLIAYK